MKISLILIFFLVIFFLIKSSLALELNEIYPNPFGKDEDDEWIELFAEESDKGNWTIGDLSSNSSFSLNFTGFLILTRNKTKFLEFWNVASNKIIEISGIKLNNNGDEIFLFNNSTLIDSVKYPSFSNKEGKSFAKLNGSWVVCSTPTPLSPNFCKEEKKEEKKLINILYIPTQLKFGSLGFLIFEFNSSEIKFSNLKFLVYGYPKRVVVDSNQKRIVKFSSCDADTSLLINTSNSSHIISLPFFIYPNCDEYYKEGNYQLGLRICYLDNDTWKTLDKILFNVSLRGRNENLCPKKEIVYKFIQKVKEKSQVEEKQLKILSYPLIVRVGEEFEVIVEVKNSENSTKNYTIYSYVYSGKKLISEGFDGSNWRKTWNANKKLITLRPGERKRVSLKNRIKNSVKGEFVLKVRVKDVVDEKVNIRVLPRKIVKFNYSCYSSENSSKLKLKNYGDELEILIIYVANQTKVKKIVLKKNQTKILSFPFRGKGEFLIVFGDEIKKCYVYSPQKLKPKKITARATSLSVIGKFFNSLLHLFGSLKLSNLINNL